MTKPKTAYALVTVHDMFHMIEDFADGFMEQLNPDQSQRGIMIDMSEAILHTFRDQKMDGRLGILILLHTACAMYEMARREAIDKKTIH